MKSFRLIATLGTLLVFNIAITFTDRAEADSFGSGDQAFDIEFVKIGNPGNAADTSGKPSVAGAVRYDYRIGKYEISEQMVDAANTAGQLGITQDAKGANKPATNMTWNETARFINWLNTSSGSPPAYKFILQPGDVGYDANSDIELWTASDPGYNSANRYRNSLAKYFLPSVDEWYKAAFYDPSSDSYLGFPTPFGYTPTAVESGTDPGTAVYYLPRDPADITQAGGLNVNGTMGQGGNVAEWQETDWDLRNGPVSTARVIRGGFWQSFSGELHRTSSSALPPSSEWVTMGFRIASTFESTIGDTNGDSVVDLNDLNNVRNNFGATGLGDTDGDNDVDLDDLNAVRNNFGAGGANPVPEPSSHALLALGAVGIVARRRMMRR